MYDDELLYKLWLSIACNHDPKLTQKCISGYGSAEEIYKSDKPFKGLIPGMRLSRALKARRSLDRARELCEYCAENAITIIPIGDKRYPKRLSQVYAPPQILYVKGELPDIDNLVCVTVVGARDCSEFGRGFANELASELTKSGIMIVSGMANGIDSAAHIGALSVGGKTVAALAGGVDVIYPKGNSILYNHIIENGAVISERPPGTVGKGSFYRERNRILVGLSVGVVIVEGALSGGTKLTATWATDENRDLYAVPGRPGDKGAELPNRLIKDNAKLITSAEDVISEYISVYADKLKCGMDLIDKEKGFTAAGSNAAAPCEIPKEKRMDLSGLDAGQRKVMEYLYQHGEDVHIDEISRECGISAAELGTIIIGLLMIRAIKEYPGEYYSANRD